MQKREQEGEAEIWLPCKISEGMFPTERYVRIPSPSPYYEPSINGWVPLRMLNDPGGECGEEREGFVRASVLKKDADEIVVAFGGELNHSDGVRIPVAYLEERGIQVP